VANKDVAKFSNPQKMEKRKKRKEKKKGHVVYLPRH
jgi:hypothetical protein